MNLVEAFEYFKSIGATWNAISVKTDDYIYRCENQCHTVNIYRGHKEVDCFCFGDLTEDRTRIDEFWIAVAEHDKGIASE